MTLWLVIAPTLLIICVVNNKYIERFVFFHLPYYFPSYQRTIHWWLRDLKKACSKPSAILKDRSDRSFLMTLSVVCTTHPAKKSRERVQFTNQSSLKWSGLIQRLQFARAVLIRVWAKLKEYQLVSILDSIICEIDAKRAMAANILKFRR